MTRSSGGSCSHRWASWMKRRRREKKTKIARDGIGTVTGMTTMSPTVRDGTGGSTTITQMMRNDISGEGLNLESAHEAACGLILRRRRNTADAGATRGRGDGTLGTMKRGIGILVGGETTVDVRRVMTQEIDRALGHRDDPSPGRKTVGQGRPAVPLDIRTTRALRAEGTDHGLVRLAVAI